MNAFDRYAPPLTLAVSVAAVAGIGFLSTRLSSQHSSTADQVQSVLSGKHPGTLPPAHSSCVTCSTNPHDPHAISTCTPYPEPSMTATTPLPNNSPAPEPKKR